MIGRKIPTRPPKTQHQTVEAYFALDDNADAKYEYIDGEIVPVSGASYAHNLIVSNLVCALGNQVLGTSHMVLASNMRVVASPKTAYFYPDVLVVGDDPALLPDHQDTLTNPIVLIEVLSPDSDLQDRGVKFNQYRQISELKAYLLVAQDAPYIELFTHQKGNLWLYTTYEGTGAAVTLTAINATLRAAEVYLNVEFPPFAEEPNNDDEP